MEGGNRGRSGKQCWNYAMSFMARYEVFELEIC